MSAVGQARYREKHPDRVRAGVARARRRHPDTKRNCELRRLYGITAADFDALEQAQRGACALCGKMPGKKRLHVDHDHETGVIRGLLCSSCNAAIGALGDSAEGIERALAYIRRLTK